MEPQNQKALAPFLKRVKERFPEKSIWLYSGYLWEQLTGDVAPNCPSTAEILSEIDVLVDGRFLLEQKDVRLKFRGSANQRVLDVKGSLLTGDATWLAGYHPEEK